MLLMNFSVSGMRVHSSFWSCQLFRIFIVYFVADRKFLDLGDMNHSCPVCALKVRNCKLDFVFATMRSISNFLPPGGNSDRPCQENGARCYGHIYPGQRDSIAAYQLQGTCSSPPSLFLILSYSYTTFSESKASRTDNEQILGPACSNSTSKSRFSVQYSS